MLELVEGETLEDRIARGPMAVAEALHVARQIAEALDAAPEVRCVDESDDYATASVVHAARHLRNTDPVAVRVAITE